jgi:hypothetical protein
VIELEFNFGNGPLNIENTLRRISLLSVCAVVLVQIHQFHYEPSSRPAALFIERL